MKYILIWTIWTYVVNTGTVATGSAEFFDASSCQYAAATLRKVESQRTNVLALCFPKGE